MEQILPLNRTERTFSAGLQKFLADRLALLCPFSASKFLQDFFVLGLDTYLQVCPFLRPRFPSSPAPYSKGASTEAIKYANAILVQSEGTDYNNRNLLILEEWYMTLTKF